MPLGCSSLAGDWDGAHKIVQEDEADATSCWIHAVLHKIEGDAGNSRYWYARAGQSYEAYPDAKAELAAIKAALTYYRWADTTSARHAGCAARGRRWPRPFGTPAWPVTRPSRRQTELAAIKPR